jgi:plasmid stability protein
VNNNGLAPLDMRLTCDHRIHMPTMIQIRNVPDDLHRRLKARAAMAGMSLSDFLLAQIRESAALPTPEEMKARLQGREPMRLSISVADAVRAERDAH